MRDLRVYFTNPFSVQHGPLSWATFRRLTEEHLARISAPGTPAPIAALVAPTAAAFAAVFGKLSDATTAEAVRQALTAANDAAMADFIAFTKRKEAAILSVFPKDAPEYQEFFPQGMAQYREMNKGNAEQIMTQMTKAVDKYKSQLEPDLDSGFAARLERFMATRTAQLSQKGVADDRSEEADTLRATLEEQFYVNLCVIGAHFRGNVEAASIYIDQSMVRDNKDDKEEDDEAPTPPPVI